MGVNETDTVADGTGVLEGVGEGPGVDVKVALGLMLGVADTLGTRVEVGVKLGVVETLGVRDGVKVGCNVPVSVELG